MSSHSFSSPAHITNRSTPNTQKFQSKRVCTLFQNPPKHVHLDAQPQRFPFLALTPFTWSDRTSNSAYRKQAFTHSRVISEKQAVRTKGSLRECEVAKLACSALQATRISSSSHHEIGLVKWEHRNATRKATTIRTVENPTIKCTGRALLLACFTAATIILARPYCHIRAFRAALSARCYERVCLSSFLVEQSR